VSPERKKDQFIAISEGSLAAICARDTACSDVRGLSVDGNQMSLHIEAEV
jgi:hypothetical protein